MIWEATLHCPWEDNYSKHRFVEQLFKGETGQERRDYLWAYVPGHEVIVRYHQPLRPEFYHWQPLEAPPIGSRLRFTLLTQVRGYLDDHARRSQSVDQARNLDWIVYTSQAKLGWNLLDESVDMETISIRVQRLDAPERRKNFVMQATQFTGIADVSDPQMLEHALIKGVGNGKAFGMGFIFFTNVQGTR